MCISLRLYAVLPYLCFHMGCRRVFESMVADRGPGQSQVFFFLVGSRNRSIPQGLDDTCESRPLYFAVAFYWLVAVLDQGEF